MNRNDSDKVREVSKGSALAIALDYAHDAGKDRDGYAAASALSRFMKWLTGEDHRLCIGSAYRKGQEATMRPVALTADLLDTILDEATGAVARVVQDALGEAAGDAAGVYFPHGYGVNRGEHGELRALVHRFAVWHAIQNGIPVEANVALDEVV